ncbi:hypothetical protein KQQSB11_300236 [Klebsiella quasipneumoniae subsp. quasipneumoniae]|nr:hypothetical protein KQQSB11_300236 [Klebsiella quasipneumoniae subsp. quasipneumoniae]
MCKSVLTRRLIVQKIATMAACARLRLHRREAGRRFLRHGGRQRRQPVCRRPDLTAPLDPLVPAASAPWPVARAPWLACKPNRVAGGCSRKPGR